MKLPEFLTKPIGVGSDSFLWKEPTLYRIRLRGDFWLRLAVVFGAWAAGTGVLWALFANNIHRPGLGLGVGVGSLFGLVALILVFFLRDHVSGRVRIDADGIRRFRTYGGLTPDSWAEWQEWPFAAISRCAIVPAATLDKSFSVMLLSLGDDREIVGLPKSVDVSRLAKHLAKRGVSVTQAKGLPAQFAKRLPLAVAAAVPVAGLVTLCGGLAFFLSARGDAGGARLPQDRRFPQDQPALIVVDNTDQRANPSRLPRGETVDVSPSEEGFGFGAAPKANGPVRPEPNTMRFRETEAIGGAGGFAFSQNGTAGKPVLGFRCNFGQWADKQWVRQLVPLYGDDPPFPGWQIAMARPGYAVGGLHLDTPEFVNAFAVIFMRIRPDGTLDVEDSYAGDWIGPKSESPVRTLISEGAIVTGIHGRAGAILNAVGLVLERH